MSVRDADPGERATGEDAARERRDDGADATTPPTEAADAPAVDADRERPAERANAGSLRPSTRAAIALGALPAIALVLVAAWEIAATARAGADVPGDDAWQRASALVRARHRPGDLIVFAPRWIDPVGRLHLGDLIPVHMAARMDAARHGTIWELSIRGARAPETRGLTPASSESAGGIAVRRYVRDPVAVVTDFVDAFGRARVTGHAASRVEVRIEEVGFEPHRCVRVEPRPDRTVRVTYTGVALGASLVGYAGLADVFTRRDIRDPGRLDVTVDGQPAARVDLGVDDGWVRFEVATMPRAAAEVVFAATAVGPGARKRLVCFAAEARR